MSHDWKANWSKWKYIPDVRIWEGVALSMNIDPKHMGKSNEGWLAGESEVLERSLEFKERLDLTTRNSERLTIKTLSTESPARHAVTLSSIAALMISINRTIPDEMVEIVDAATTSGAGMKWPWGSHETKLLGHLIGAVKKFWLEYDPTEPDTAPTNKQVADWLKSNGVSKRVSEVIAQIIRADDVPAGNRKR